MDKALRVVLSSIASKTGLTVSQVIEETESGTISRRYESCKSCIMPRCDRCQVMYSKQIPSKQ
ncbi:hypothetical protein NVP1205O_30 [Vibrio phage 1.205.O._10N.222.51.A7]|nr:hypothetical protein NVP1205O_30 [Vibrio phage 1.205.O._10N.222.51.A7]